MLPEREDLVRRKDSIQGSPEWKSVKRLQKTWGWVRRPSSSWMMTLNMQPDHLRMCGKTWEVTLTHTLHPIYPSLILLHISMIYFVYRGGAQSLESTVRVETSKTWRTVSLDDQITTALKGPDILVSRCAGLGWGCSGHKEIPSHHFSSKYSEVCDCNGTKNQRFRGCEYFCKAVYITM